MKNIAYGVCFVALTLLYPLHLNAEVVGSQYVTANGPHPYWTSPQRPGIMYVMNPNKTTGATRPFLNNLKITDGYYTVIAHGNESQGCIDDNGFYIEAPNLAAMIKSDPNYTGQPVRLMACNTGSQSYAQTLANLLGVIVEAPNGNFHPFNDGTYAVWQPNHGPQGWFVSFTPTTQSPGVPPPIPATTTNPGKGTRQLIKLNDFR